MPRPSRNLDHSLLAAGRKLFPQRGCAGLAVREVADAAGVNLGMFHYHFKSREAFLRAVMQQAYEEMFATLTLEVGEGGDPVASLARALRVLGRFLRDNRAFLARVLADALTGEACARDFLRDNLPRHLAVLHRLVREGQAQGRVVELPVIQLVATCAGSLALPILVGGALLESGLAPAPFAAEVEASLLSDAGLDQRIDLAMAAISKPPRKRTPTKKARS
jgi:AcrR family transcriptional regulator